MMTRQKLFLRLLFALSALVLGVIFFVNVDSNDVVGDLTRRGLLTDEGIMPEESGRVPEGTYHYPDESVVHVVREENDDHFFAKEERTRELDHVEDHFIVELNLSPGDDPHVACFELAESIGGEVDYVFIGLFTGCEIIPSEISGMSGTDMEESLNTVSGVGAIMKNGPIEAYNTGTGIDPIWSLDRIDQCSLPLDGNSFKEDASNVKIFIVDSGIRADHEEFVGMINPNDACHYSHPFNLNTFHTENPPPLVDGNGHGTHVAGTVCGYHYGVASNCQLCSVKVLKGSTKDGSYTAFLAGINHIHAYCTANPGTRCVVNMSLGGYTNALLNQQIENAVASGIVVVAAAGNHNRDACNYSPASATSSIAVGATTIHDARWTQTDSQSSNFGSCVDVWAPGAGILSASSANVNVYSTKDGTSMASPHVTGIAAAILSGNPTFTPQQVASAIIASSSTLSDPTLAGASSLVGLKFVATTCTSCTSSDTLPAHCTNPPTSSPTSTPTSSPTSKPTQQCLNVGTRLTSYGQTCSCSTLRTVCLDTSGRCCSGFCRITVRGVSVCREAPPPPRFRPASRVGVI